MTYIFFAGSHKGRYQFQDGTGRWKRPPNMRQRMGRYVFGNKGNAEEIMLVEMVGNEI